MFRLLGQFLSLLAAMISVINVQCVLSCSLQGIDKNHGNAIHSKDHACCPERTAPAKNSGGKQPCPLSLVTTSYVAITDPVHFSNIPQLLETPTVRSAGLDLLIASWVPPIFVDSAGVPNAPAFAILRV